MIRQEITTEEAIEEIVGLNSRIRDFWGDGGWAPGGAARLLMKSRLDRQVSLAVTLRLWLDGSCDELREVEGRLILGWANLGAPVEGTMKWFLCVYEHNYAAHRLRDRRGRELDPDRLQFVELCRFFKEHVWTRFADWYPRTEKIRARRNAIHAYQDRDIGTLEELYDAIRSYRDFILDVDSRVPYPD